MINLVPSRANPRYFQEFRSPSPNNLAYPPMYEVGGRSSEYKKSNVIIPRQGSSANRNGEREPKAIIREILEPVYFKEPPAYNDKSFVSTIYFLIRKLTAFFLQNLNLIHF
jgi:hypothetical protein